MSADAAEEPDRSAHAPHPRETSVLFGQEAAEARFLAALEAGRLPHGWLIAGPRGIGKATLAWRIARHMAAGAAGGSLALDRSDPVFRRVAALGAPEILLCRRPWDEKTRRLRTAITVDEVRALKSFFQLSAVESGWRIAIVDAADELNDAAANALLKILEEPPARALLLMVAHQPARLLPTLRSRCATLACAPLGPEALGRALQAAGIDAGEDAQALASLAGGSVGRAVELVAANGLALYAEIAALIGAAPPIDRRRAIALAEACAGRGAEARYDATVTLTALALSRLALSGAGRALPPATPPEAAAFARLGRTPAQARLWAELAAGLEARVAHARAVHLDPAQVILDTFLQIDAAAAQAHAQAA